MDVSESALRYWVVAAKEPEGGENSRIKELEVELKKLKRENDDLKDMVNVLKNQSPFLCGYRKGIGF